MTPPTAVVAKPVESAEPAVRLAQQTGDEEGLTFSGTPGPAYSEGGARCTNRWSPPICA